MREEKFIPSIMSRLRNPDVVPGDEAEPVRPDYEVRPGMSVDERLALLRSEPASPPHPRVELPANQDPFSLLSTARTPAVELYRNEATELFGVCDDTFAVFASHVPVHRDRLGKKGGRSMWQNLPSVKLGDSSYYMRRTVAPDEEEVSYNFLRSDEAYEDSGFTLSKTKNGVTLIRRAGWEETDTDDDATYSKLLHTAERWVKDYAMFVPKPEIRPEPKHVAQIKVSQHNVDRYRPYARHYRLVRGLAMIAMTPTILVNGLDIVLTATNQLGQSEVNQSQGDTVTAKSDSKPHPQTAAIPTINGVLWSVLRTAHDAIAPLAIVEVAPHAFDIPKAKKS